MLFREKKTCLLFAVGVALGAALVFVGYPGGVLAAFRDTRDMPELLARLKADAERRKVLNQRSVAMKCRMDFKDRLIDELIAGRATLAEVSVRFHELNASYPPCMQMIRQQYPYLSDDERIALNVIEFVRLNDMPGGRREEVEARLGAQFYATFGREVRYDEDLVRVVGGEAGGRAVAQDGLGAVRPPPLHPGSNGQETTAEEYRVASLGRARPEGPTGGIRRFRREMRTRSGSAP